MRRQLLQDLYRDLRQARQTVIVRQKPGSAGADGCRKLYGIWCSEVVACAQSRSFLGDALVQRNRGQSGRVEEDIAILLSQLGATFAKWVDQDFNKGDERSHHTEFVALRRFEERLDLGEKARVFFNVVDQRPRIQTDCRAAKRLYPFHDERSRRRYSSTSTPCQTPLPKP